MAVASLQSQVRLTPIGAEPGPKLPKSIWTFEVGLENRGDEARWYLIPEPPEKGPGLERAAHALDVLELGSGPARARLLRISATHDLLAVRLAAGASRILRNLRLVSWDEDPLRSVEIWSVAEIHLDGRPLGADRLGGIDLLQRGNGTVDAGVQEILFSWSEPELRDHPLAYEALERWTFALREPGRR